MSTRRTILEYLYRIYYEDAYASLLLRHTEGKKKEEMAFMSEVIYGTLRNRMYCTYQWEDFVKKACKRKTRVLLDMSVYQLFFLDRIPAYAIVDEAVNLADKGERNFVNAILHKVIARGKKEVVCEDPLEQASILYSEPQWLMKLWQAHYGQETALAIAKSYQTRAQVYGRINTLKCKKEELSQDERYHFVDEVTFTYDGILQDSEAFQKGEVLIQDYASSQVVPYLEVKPGMKVMDCCSAPGTKAQHIAMLLENKGEVVASDIYEDRVKLIDELMAKTGVTICRSLVRDACIDDGRLEEEGFDRILFDVPCSGLGDLRHKPEIRYHVLPENIDTLVAIQKRILDTNSKYLKKGGILVYSTCTLNKKENEHQIAHFLARHPEFECIQEKTIFPFEHNSDGFYIAQLRKI